MLCQFPPLHGSKFLAPLPKLLRRGSNQPTSKTDRGPHGPAGRGQPGAPTSDYWPGLVCLGVRRCRAAAKSALASFLHLPCVHQAVEVLQRMDQKAASTVLADLASRSLVGKKKKHKLFSVDLGLAGAFASSSFTKNVFIILKSEGLLVLCW